MDDQHILELGEVPRKMPNFPPIGKQYIDLLVLTWLF